MCNVYAWFKKNKNPVGVKQNPLNEITFIIGKCDDKLQYLFNQSKQALERKTATEIGIVNREADEKTFCIWSRIKQLF